MKKMALILFALTVFISVAVPSYAAIEDWKPSPWTEQKTYVDKSINKLGFGLTNLTIGWTAIPFEMAENNNIYTGFFMGLWRTATNTVGGLLHTATFPIPVDIPLPDGGVHFE